MKWIKMCCPTLPLAFKPITWLLLLAYTHRGHYYSEYEMGSAGLGCKWPYNIVMSDAK